MPTKNNAKQKRKLTTVETSRLIILFFFISFVGWIFEKVGRYFVYNSVTDRGFLTTPICPIYGFSILIICLLIGTPDSSPLNVKFRENSKIPKFFKGFINFFIYFIATTVLISIIELATGFFFKEVMGVPLWNYEDRFMNLGGYICLSYSLMWGALISLYMLLGWKPLRNLAKKINPKASLIFASVICIGLTADFIFNVIYLIRFGTHFNFL